MTVFEEAITTARRAAIAHLFSALPDNVEYIGLDADGDVIEGGQYVTAAGTQVWPYPEEGAYGPLNDAFGVRHQALAGYEEAGRALPPKVRTQLHALPQYRYGKLYILRRPLPEGVKRPKYKPAREDGMKSWTVSMQGGLTPTREVWASSAAAARRAAGVTLPRLARITGVVRTPA